MPTKIVLSELPCKRIVLASIHSTERTDAYNMLDIIESIIDAIVDDRDSQQSKSKKPWIKPVAYLVDREYEPADTRTLIHDPEELAELREICTPNEIVEIEFLDHAEIPQAT